MINRFEQYVITRYLDNLVKHLGPRSNLNVPIAEWVSNHGYVIGITIPEEKYAPVDGRHAPAKPPIRRRHGLFQHVRGTRKLKLGVLPELKKLIGNKARSLRASRKSPLQQNLEALAGATGLDKAETEILGFVVRSVIYNEFESLCSELSCTSLTDMPRLLGAMLGLSSYEILRRLSPEKHLIRCGLLKHNKRRHSQDLSDVITPPDAIVCTLMPPNRGLNDIQKFLFGTPCNPELLWDDFDHIREDRDLITEMLSGAIKKGERGINVLLYGMPGTGKTEFCKTVAHHLGLNLYAVGEEDDYGDEPDRRERLSMVRLASHFLANQSGTILLFDEMEDLQQSSFNFFPPHRKMDSKVFVNRILEQNAVPTFWTCNDINSFDPALIRRMTLTIEMKTPSPAVRERVWTRLLKKNRVKISCEAVANLAREFKEPPALAATAVRAAKLAGGGEDQIRKAVRSMAKAVNGGHPVRPIMDSVKNYEPVLINADNDLNALTARIAGGIPCRNFSLCLYGPPGTGKSAYARHLAGEMEMEVIQKRASDLISMWVGGTEKNIAEAFEEAREQEAFLIFDEADSLLQSRSSAESSWEISQVNEMLTWMESHPFPFACTTNLMESLDSASLRRFTFKTRFGYLSAEQADLAFYHFLGLAPPKGLKKLSVLTPGDFAVVRRKAEITGDMDKPRLLLAMLRDECKAKPDNPKPIGFAA